MKNILLLLAFVCSSVFAGVQEVKYRQATVGAPVQATSGSYTAVGSAAGALFSKLYITSTIGEPLSFGTSKNACSTVAPKFMINRGDGPITFDVTIGSGNVICVKSMTASSATSGEIVINLGSP